jgi:ABC-type iron transport system FetAB ATPase subunit
VTLDGVDCASMRAPEWRRRVAMLPAESQWWHDTVGPHFAELDGGADGWLRDLGFHSEVMTWHVSRLSSGERQRLAIVRLLALRPSVLLLDEPTASLDPDNVARAEEVLARYRRDHSAPVLWVSHSREQLRRVATRCCRVGGGAVSEEPCA